jgi:hypothetical protein
MTGPEGAPRGNTTSGGRRLTTAGIDVRTVAELGGWRTLAMVER